MFHFNLQEVSDTMLEHLRDACKEQIRKNQEQLSQVTAEIVRRKGEQQQLNL